MMTPPALALGLLLVVVLDAAPAAAQSRVPSPPPRPPVTSRRETEADRLAAMIVRTTREYVASLERMRAAYKKEADSFAEMVEVRRELFERGIISRRDVEIAEELLAEANRKVQGADRWIKDANDIRQSVLGEAALHSELAKTTLPRGGYMATGVFIRFNGTAAFSLSDLPLVVRFFSSRFGRPLPVSAFGQTTVHDRIGFDHRNGA
jgi:hypothetical protein